MNRRTIKPMIEKLNEELRTMFLDEIIFDNKLGGFILEGNTQSSKTDIIKVAEDDSNKMCFISCYNRTS